MTKLIYDREGLRFSSESLEDQLILSECLHSANALERPVQVSIVEKGKEKRRTKMKELLNWHNLITENTGRLEDLPAVEALRNWGIDVCESSIRNVQHVFNAKVKKYSIDTMSIEDVKDTPQYKRALQLVKDKYGGPLSDGRQLFEYQLECAAMIIAKKRLLLALDMGMGKTLTSLAGLSADPANKKILIVTMSRNINDWVREIKVLGLSEDYIILKNGGDLKSDKRIHLVSYEKWSGERIRFKHKRHEKCPNCNSAHFYWNKVFQYCSRCKEKFEPEEERYSNSELPEKCPDCHSDWKRGAHHCDCGFTVIESKKKSLSHYYHNGYDACAIDEIHFIKNGDSGRSEAVRKINTKTRIGLSGTPSENGASELFWPLGFLTGFSSRFEDPFLREPYKRIGKRGEEHFRAWFGGGPQERVLDVSGVKARVSRKEQLWDFLDTIMIRKTKQDEDVKDDIEVPKPVHHRKHLEQDFAEKKLYTNLIEQFQEWYSLELLKKEQAEARGEVYRINSIQICTWMDKLRKAASAPWLFDEYDSSLCYDVPTKVRYLKEKAKEYLRKGKKMLVFTSHKDTAEQLGVMLDGIETNQSAAYIHGGVDMSYRFEIMDRFQDPDDDLKILVMTVRTGAESYTLTEAKAVFLYDLDFNGKKIEQCWSRAVRLGQKEKVDIHWLLSVGTIDINIHGLILSKLSGVDLAIDRKELDFSELAKEFEGEGATASSINFEEFATDMLAAGTSREQIMAG